MAQLIVPLSPVPSQTVTVNLNNQVCQITVYQKHEGMFLDLLVNGAPVVYGVICQNANYIVRYSYLPFVGDLYFIDTQGIEPPYYAGIGNRWLLVYEVP